jgi:(2Fe-2S) ferredoxin
VSSELEKGLEKARIKDARKHLFLCLGPDCCRSKEGELLWEHVKKRLKDAKFHVMRTKAGCFRICTNGPWLVVYPDGVWYQQVTPLRFDRILRDHILGGHPVTEWIAARNDLHPSC